MAQSFTSQVKANLNATALAGNCLAMAQSIVGAPVNYPSATVAGNATKYRHATRSMPNSLAVAWFDHWGSYGVPGREVYANWGHVVIWIPGRGFASSSPVAGEVSRPYFYSSLGEVERAFNCSFRFWSEDLNGLRVTKPAASASPKEDKVIPYHRSYRKAREIDPGEKLYLVDGKGAKSNCIGGVGEYSLTAHVYGDGFAPGDALDVFYEWATDKGKKISPHYVERVVADADGVIRANPSFKRGAVSGTAVHLAIVAPKRNTKPGTVSVLDSDAHLHVKA